MDGGNLMDFVQRFQQLHAQRDTSDELIKDLLVYCEHVESSLRQENSRLRSQISDANLDLADATKSRRELQQHVKELEQQITFMTIDVDHLKFKQEYINRGIEGGKQAAYALRTAILKECHALAGDIEVIARVVANLNGLTKAMRNDGSLDHEARLKDFTIGLSQGMASPSADSHPAEAIRWNLRNFNCKQIVLGVSHDAGYASFLDEILRDEASRRRITILEGVPSTRDLASKNLNTLDLNADLLRAEKLVDKTLRDPTPPSAVSSPVAVVAGMSPLPPPSATPVSVTASVASSYATAIKSASPPPQVTLPFQPKSAKAPVVRREKAPLWNPGFRGLDPPLEVNQAALDNIKKRKDNNKLCNNHYLRGPCAKGDSCCFEHKYRPNEAERTAIAFLARLNPCTNGQDCEVEDCIYGHHCPSTRDGTCTHPYCKFKPFEHPPGTKFRQTYQWLDEV
ncbi:hypothetical protein DHEL01_v210214 [Diaporthe helianthi]|uniref:C3H1-type domain-containing protein n=1 Tax=Diaporthe helianthi TaxID=158607 RepID=A0A2P5HMA6_DIAHE|nr:hypothetical protein DHEL01_v210214 [Diaporthe helianthi]